MPDCWFWEWPGWQQRVHWKRGINVIQVIVNMAEGNYLVLGNVVVPGSSAINTNINVNPVARLLPTVTEVLQIIIIKEPVYGGMGNNSRSSCQSCQAGGGVAGAYGMSAGGVVPPPLAIRGIAIHPTILHYPGTRGTAYSRPTRMMPVDGPDSHPREAGLDIYAPGATDIRVVALNVQRDEMIGYRDPANDDIWEFVTKRPLIPGVQHVYQVYAIFPETGDVPQTRRVRLIMGRIVELSYKKYNKNYK